jgi:hypothetical protein
MTRQDQRRIIRAVMTAARFSATNGTFPFAWFHSHAAGRRSWRPRRWILRTGTAYTQSVESNDSDRAPDAVKNWTATFTREVRAAREGGDRRNSPHH